MKHQFDKEACPACGSEDYTIKDYREDFNDEEARQCWRCYCFKCGCMFDMERVYELTDISVSRADRDD